MIFGIIAGAIVVAFLLGLYQKKKEKEVTIFQNQKDGGFRTKFPELEGLLRDDLNMDLVTDTGDDFFYQAKVSYNYTKEGLLRIGRRIEFINTIEFYTEFFDEFSSKFKGLPMAFSDDKTKPEYKEFISKSLKQIFDNNLKLTDPTFKSLLSHGESEEKKEDPLYVSEYAALGLKEPTSNNYEINEEENVYRSRWRRMSRKLNNSVPSELFIDDRIDPDLFLNNLKYLEYSNYSIGNPTIQPPSKSILLIGYIPTWYSYYFAAGYPDATNWFLNNSLSYKISILELIKENPEICLDKYKQLNLKYMVKILVEYKKNVTAKFECATIKN